jgi:two-component system, NarL family, response regulator DesR
VIRILLGQRGTLMREALATVLSQEEDLIVVARVAQRDDVVPLALRERPDVAVLDWGLPGTIPLTDLCITLHGVQPMCGVLVMLDPASSAGGGADLARLAPRVGLIALNSSPSDLIEGVRQMARGEPVLDAEVALAALTAEENPLTDRERDVLRLALHGAPAKEIARSLRLSTGTVRNYLSRIVTKTGARTHIDAIRRAQDAGWI